jgi:hypothetical protein
VGISDDSVEISEKRRVVPWGLARQVQLGVNYSSSIAASPIPTLTRIIFATNVTSHMKAIRRLWRMPDAAQGVRQLVLLHGRAAAREMVEPQVEPLVRIASEVLGDEKGRSGYSYSGLCLTSLPHRKLADDQPWERSVGPLTLIIEPGRIFSTRHCPLTLDTPHHQEQLQKRPTGTKARTSCIAISFCIVRP